MKSSYTDHEIAIMATMLTLVFRFVWPMTITVGATTSREHVICFPAFTW
jgi:hypothetical protein